MIKLEAKIKGIKMNAPALKRAMARGSEDPILKGAILVQRAAQRLVSKGARRWKLPNGEVRYKGSKPGEPPMLRTGELRASIMHAVTPVRGGLGASAVIGPTKRQEDGGSVGKTLEFGTRTLAKRPFMRPSLGEVRGEFPKLFKGMLKGQVVR